MPVGGLWRVFGELDYRDQETSDPRYGYVREQVWAGVAWEI